MINRKGKSGEELLQETADKFERRFRFMEKELLNKEIKMEDCSLDELEKLWQKAKLSS